MIELKYSRFSFMQTLISNIISYTRLKYIYIYHKYLVTLHYLYHIIFKTNLKFVCSKRFKCQSMYIYLCFRRSFKLSLKRTKFTRRIPELERIETLSDSTLYNCFKYFMDDVVSIESGQASFIDYNVFKGEIKHPTSITQKLFVSK